jgi:hypothetical protein
VAVREHMERLETAAEGPGHHLDRFTRRAAVLVAMLAGLLAVATLLSNEAVKESINSATHAADSHTLYETNEVKAYLSRGQARELELLAEGASSSKAAQAERHAAQLDMQAANSFAPRDRLLARRSDAAEREHETHDEQHFRYELAMVALEIAIVLASIAIITRLGWLIGGGLLGGVAGVALILSALAL